VAGCFLSQFRGDWFSLDSDGIPTIRNFGEWDFDAGGVVFNSGETLEQALAVAEFEDVPEFLRRIQDFIEEFPEDLEQEIHYLRGERQERELLEGGGSSRKKPDEKASSRVNQCSFRSAWTFTTSPAFTVSQRSKRML